MEGLGLYLLFLVPPLIIGFVIQHRLKTTVNQQMQVAVASGMTGEQVARMILERNGLGEIPVEPSPGGPLSDHYDPRKRSVHLSGGVYEGHAVASVAIAAHEASLENLARAYAATKSPEIRKYIDRSAPIIQKHLEKAKRLQNAGGKPATAK